MNDPFHLGSVAKPMTATLAARLVEAGRLAWDTRLREVAPALLHDAHPAYLDITLAQLLAHEAGVPAYADTESIASIPRFAGDIVEQRRAFARWLLAQPPLFSPGQDAVYSNAGYVLAAVMLETVSEQSWEALMRQEVFEPLGMHAAGFGWPDRDGAWGHRRTSTGLQPVDPEGGFRLPAVLAPAGGVHATANDMARFAAAHLDASRGGTDWLREETAREMLARRKEGGLGWGLQSAFGFELVAYHEGSINTFFALLMLVPKADRGFFVAVNAGGAAAEDDAVRLLREAAREHLPR